MKKTYYIQVYTIDTYNDSIDDDYRNYGGLCGEGWMYEIESDTAQGAMNEAIEQIAKATESDESEFDCYIIDSY